MRPGVIFIALAAALVMVGQTTASFSQSPMPSMWVNPDGTARPEPTVPFENAVLSIKKMSESSAHSKLAAGQNGRVALIIYNSVYDSISTSVAQLESDLADDGYSTVNYKFSSGTAVALRTYLAGLYAEPAGLKGAIFIGSIPYVIYEMMQSWSGETPVYQSFPCDLFFMDLNGTWSDTLTNGQVLPNNGKYDTHTGSTGLEIWVGRLKANNLGSLGTEVTLLNSYLARNHQYRYYSPQTQERGLVYDDDDWADMAPGDKTCQEGCFGTGNVESFNVNAATTGADYMTNRLPVDRRWVHIRSHGYAQGHMFKSPDGDGWVQVADYRRIDPPVSFYSLFVCSGADYTTSDNLAGTIVFNQSTPALFAIGSSKTGGMLWDDYFWTPLSQGKCLGEAFKAWFNAAGYYSPQWTYGQVMLGDPTIVPGADTSYQTLTISASPTGSGTTVPAVGTYTYTTGTTVNVIAIPKPACSFTGWDGPVTNPLIASSKVTVTSDSVITARFNAPTIATIKNKADNTSVTVVGKAVSAKPGSDCLYVEDDSRQSGIRVTGTNSGISVGQRIVAQGTIGTLTGTSERCITASSIVATGTGTVEPLGMTARSIGGGDWYYSTSNGMGQKGFTGLTGLNNIGLLVTTTGNVESINSTSFRLRYGGYAIKVIVPVSVTVPNAGQFVAVTGAVSVELVEGNRYPILLPTEQADIVPF